MPPGTLYAIISSIHAAWEKSGGGGREEEEGRGDEGQEQTGLMRVSVTLYVIIASIQAAWRGAEGGRERGRESKKRVEGGQARLMTSTGRRRT